jgi:cytoplasmic FMR1 interacting protein
MQVVPWLGVVPNKAGQLQQLLCDDNFSPLVSLFKNATNEILKNPDCLNSKAFVSMSKQAEVAGHHFWTQLSDFTFSCFCLTYISKFPLSLNFSCLHLTLKIQGCVGCVCVCVDILYMNNLQTGSVLDYTLKFLVAVLVRSRERWDFPSKSGLIEITVSKEYHRIYSAIQFVSNLVLKITQ